MIGIIGAMDAEIDYLKRIAANIEINKISGMEFLRGKIHNKDVVISKCGIGKVFAAICTQTMINEYKPDVIINTGVAGSLSTELGICAVAVGTDVVQYDMDTSALGDPVGLISGLDLVHIPCTKSIADLLSKIVCGSGAATQQGTIASADRFQSDRQEKDRIKNSFGAIACDMESGSIGQVCFVNGVDFGIIRAISDTADDSSHMDYFEFMPLAAEKSVMITEQFIKNYKI